ncbi:MAG TPA: bifunctional glutamate N-acetyltransferase/amino-acid acetyltransferase ArgJ [Balneolales bacterium]|nr:bifunctional glutamate N-acetyltransferase/amino-acid acetyltransferase ArgJ [Balneolales bacterium]
MNYNITDVNGFKFWGAHTGIKSKRRDLAIIYSEKPANAAAVFTRNIVVAEPVKLSRKYIENGKAQAIVVSSGNANACTGEQGRQAAIAMAETTAEGLGIPVEDVLVASTGVIGREFPTKKVVEGIKHNIPKLTKRHIAGSLVANAILTTDTFPKESFAEFKIGGKKVHMGGIAKGSGMIHPNMGTMLSFIACDADIDSKLLQKALQEVVDRTFNMITVDGDTSTNDMVAILCNGVAGNPKIETEGEDYEIFKRNLEKVCLPLAKSIVSDGEGSTKLIEYRVKNAKTEEDARQIIKTISTSALVKTAIFGRDPNWGRILAAAGRSGVNFDPDKVDLYIGTQKEVHLVKDGQPTGESLTRVKKMMKATQIHIALDLHEGNAEATGWGSDFSYEYVRINAEYTT